MKTVACRLLATLVILGVLLAALPVSGAPLRYEYPAQGDDTIQSPSAILLYMGVKPEQDAYLYEKNADTTYAPGALMRVAMIGYAMRLIEEQNINMNTATGTFTLELYNQYISGTGLDVARMKFGETWTVKDLLTLSTIRTAADCAVTLAATLSGTPEAFVEGLNAYAQELGCTNSHFTNVAGINNDGQYMSARDIAVFTREAMQYSQLRNMMEITKYSVTPVSGEKTRSWPNSCELIRQASDVYYTYAVGGKSGGSLSDLGVMAFGGSDGYEYLTVVMGAPRKNDKDEPTNIAYADARRMIRWGILGFSYATLAHKNEPVGRVKVRDCAERSSITLVPVRDLTTVLGEGIDQEGLRRQVVTTEAECVAPIEAGQVIGTLEVYHEDKLVGSVPLAAGEAAPRSFLYALWCDIWGFFTSGWFIAILIVALLVGVGYVVLNIRYNRPKRRRRKTR